MTSRESETPSSKAASFLPPSNQIVPMHCSHRINSTSSYLNLLASALVIRFGLYRLPSKG